MNSIRTSPTILRRELNMLQMVEQSLKVTCSDRLDLGVVKACIKPVGIGAWAMPSWIFVVAEANLISMGSHSAKYSRNNLIFVKMSYVNVPDALWLPHPSPLRCELQFANLFELINKRKLNQAQSNIVFTLVHAYASNGRWR